ncbi:uncharacterized protein EHS24_007669 [Apiotrichum porosum]|uniref:Mannose-P-dolichol utilization defect 1 protein homolog n=1 Tax=Apiotrichum porosum TaxID=105984 RepID=A0A427XVB9_9TREE|nr:uncharacterized protein EHS24_007669 [Apiotrichum porosum]RSH82675.1 hypothetical protein EHS24_007669 [Apiotrichum porosum]
MGFHSAVTAVTHNIPWFLRVPAEALIGEKCYGVLVYDFNITDVDCLKYALSKGLGFGIVLGGSIVKIPQIMKIIGTQSARGLSLSAYILETASYAISLAYAWRGRFPFSTYGENFFITVQNIVITLMILFYNTPKSAYNGLSGPTPLSSPPQRSLNGVFIGAAIIAICCIVLSSESLCAPPLLAFFQLCTIPLGLLSKAPQILENHTNRSTGNLSAFAVFSGLLGCLARLFTTKQEVNDPLVFWGFAGAAMLNLVLAIQMVAYWQRPLDDGKRGILEEEGKLD